MMIIQKLSVALLFCALVIAGCASSPASSESGSSKLDRARAANAAAQGGASPGAAPKPNITRDKSGKPAWVDKPDSVYDENYYIARVGTGKDRRQAEAAAFGNLTGYFGQTVKSNFQAVEGYKQRVLDGAVDVSSSTEVEQAVQISSSMESLIGAEINDVWNDDAKKTYYAVAIMDKSKTIPVYQGMIDANVGLIDRLTNIPAAHTIEAVAAYHLAASIADANAVFVTVLSMLGGPDMRSSLKTGDDYIYEADNIARQIPVNVTVENDSEGRIKSALAAALTGAGFRTGNSASRYVVNAKLSITPVDLPNQPNKFARFVLDAAFTDTTANVVLFTFNINGREGHSSQPEADQRALRKAEAQAKDEYGNALQDYLAGKH
jgi:hypothetical protein